MSVVRELFQVLHYFSRYWRPWDFSSLFHLVYLSMLEFHDRKLDADTPSWSLKKVKFQFGLKLGGSGENGPCVMVD